MKTFQLLKRLVGRLISDTIFAQLTTMHLIRCGTILYIYPCHHEWKPSCALITPNLLSGPHYAHITLH